MFKCRIFLPLVLGLASAVLVILTGAASASHASATINNPLIVYEMPLNPSGGAFEINLDAQGHLWLSDYNAEEIWELDPVGQVYTSYAGISYPGDARADDSGSVWYADASEGVLGQLSPVSGTLTLWEAAGLDGLFGTQIDGAGNVWATNWLKPLLYRFDQETRQMCSYAIPSTSASQYLQADNQSIWLADYNGEYIFRLDPTLNEYTAWSLPKTGGPVGLDLDQNHDLWWADYNLGSINRLEANLDHMTTFTLPISGNPVMLDASLDEVKFTDDINSTFGRLVTSQAISSSISLPHSTLPVTPTCSVEEPVTTTTATVSSGPMVFTQTSYTDIVDNAGWQIWQVPGASAPYGVRVSGKSTWFSDYGRQKLIWRFSGSVVSACSYADEDGDLGTTDDRTPLANWRVYLKVDDVRQEPGQLTRGSGCYTWLDLDSGHTYAVEEEIRPGWEALAPSEHDFGLAAEGELYSYNFINQSGLQATACTLIDADGNLNTTGDQAPFPGQTVYLHVDGVRQEPGLTTGADGCQTWSDLAPDHAYGVEQASAPNYALLGEAIHDFGELSPGAAVSHNFINARGVTVQACSLADADGDPLTPGDQAPLPGQTVYLLMESERQEPGLVTGADGCLAWSNLAPNHTYGLEQILSPGWEALTLSSYTFDLALPGGTFQGTFINRRINLKLFVPLIFR